MLNKCLTNRYLYSWKTGSQDLEIGWSYIPVCLGHCPFRPALVTQLLIVPHFIVKMFPVWKINYTVSIYSKSLLASQ